ncbi:FHA domain-containing protein [Pseudomonas cremoricolorata]|uniref:FHA domain-containing protein n=1 Tax=Pseudomonas cremoricolorata TaxID=157783 RepID=UPI00048A7A59|nr:FHA domain-containing protein [Pseudomonas cremoricolorata]
MSHLILSIVNLDQLLPTAIARHSFGRIGGTIGSAGTTWLLDDREHTIAPVHCEIRWIEGGFCVIDCCQRTYLNDSTLPLNGWSAMRLAEGDQLRIGAYRIRVQRSPNAALALDDVFDPNLRGIDTLIGGWPEHVQPAQEHACLVSDLRAFLEPGPDSDPLAAMHGLKGQEVWPVDALERLLDGEHP